METFDLPAEARDALMMIGAQVVSPDGEQLMAYVLKRREPPAANDDGEWRLFVAHAEAQFTYACGFPALALEPLIAAGLLQTAELPGGREVLELTDTGFRAYKSRSATSD